MPVAIRILAAVSGAVMSTTEERILTSAFASSE